MMVRTSHIACERKPQCPNRAVTLLRKRFWLAAALVPLAAFLCAVQAQDESGQEQDLAKVAHTRSGRKAKVVLTDEDLPSRPEPTKAARSHEASEASSDNSTDQKERAPDSPEKGDKSAPHSETAQITTVEGARTALENLKEQKQSLIRRYDEMERKLEAENSEFVRHLYSDALAKRNETLARVQRQIDEAEQALRTMESAKPKGETTDAAK